MLAKTMKWPVAIAVILILRFAGYGWGADETRTVRYVLNNLGTVNEVEIARVKGFFDEVGVSVEIVGVAGGGAMTAQEIISGNADLGSAPFPPQINAAAAGGKTVVIYNSGSMSEKNPGSYWLVRKESGIKGPSDLKGKVIAMGALGAMWEYGTREYLRQAGLSEDDVTIILVPPTQHDQVLKSKQVDVTVTDSPLSDAIIEDGTAEILTNTYRIYSYLDRIPPSGGLITSPEFIEKNPGTLKDLVSALIKASYWINENTEDARKIVEKVLESREQNPELAKYWKPSALDNNALLSDEQVQYWIDWFVKDGKLKEGQLTPADLYTNEFNPYFKK
ncbi:MAG: ABC transporter substrate-binding protein [Synergistaceae bacterium]|nr:ABC transporter substrate-binding protein [Synergistaceae bacterium]